RRRSCRRSSAAVSAGPVERRQLRLRHSGDDPKRAFRHEGRRQLDMRPRLEAAGAVSGSGGPMDSLRQNWRWNQMAGTVYFCVGLASIVGTAIGVRNAPEVVEDLSYLISGGIGGLFLLGVGITLLADAHLEARRTQLQQ